MGIGGTYEAVFAKNGVAVASKTIQSTFLCTRRMLSGLCWDCVGMLWDVFGNVVGMMLASTFEDKFQMS